MSDEPPIPPGETMPHDQHRSDHLPVRALRSTDLAFFRDLAQDKRVTRFVGDGAPWADSYVQQRFDAALGAGATSDRELRWFIAEMAAGARVGLLALTLRPRETEIGYWIRPGHWGNGYGTRLVEVALTIAADSRPRSPLVATVHRADLASRRILERAGFTAEVCALDATSQLLGYRRDPPATGRGS